MRWPHKFGIASNLLKTLTLLIFLFRTFSAAPATRSSSLSSSDVSKDVRFYLWTKENPSDYSTFTYNTSLETNLIDSHFRPERKTKLVIHGFMSHGLKDWVIKMKDEFLRKGDFNVISVDWSTLSDNLIYPMVVEYCEPVGFLTADFISTIFDSYPTDEISPDDIHVIGHSLGAHIAGYAGTHLNGTLARVTGLDPAEPEFYPTDNIDHLDRTDAQFVDIIHSGGPVIGLDSANGHVDFYPNSGNAPQPGCFSLDLICSHKRSEVYFVESIMTSIGFEAVQCDSWSNFKDGLCNGNPRNMMGDSVDPAKRGTFYLETNAEPPFAKGNINGTQAQR